MKNTNDILQKSLDELDHIDKTLAHASAESDLRTSIQRLQEQHRRLSSHAEAEYKLEEVLDLVQRTRRLIELVLTGSFENNALQAELTADGEKSWMHEKHLDMDPERAKAVARQMYKAIQKQEGQKILIVINANGKLIAEEAIRLCLAEDVPFEIEFEEHARTAILAKHLEDDAPHQRISESGESLNYSPLQQLANYRLAMNARADKTLRLSSNPDPNVAKLKDKEKSDLFSRKIAAINGSYKQGKPYTVTRIPTAADALQDGMELPEFTTYFLEACDQPWEAIYDAQEILKAKLDAAKEIHITNEDGTDIRLNVTGQTFANSVAMKNVPGSEVFSSPLKNGVEGVIVSKGKFAYQDSGIMEDITLRFEHGKIVEFDAKVGRDILERIITKEDTTEGQATRYLGEIGIGTNPRLDKQSINPLLVEKVGGSFHVAIGGCYQYEKYDGRPVHLKNGNDSNTGTHWDVTTLLRDKKSRIEITTDTSGEPKTEILQENGKWIIPGTEVLNEGWVAMPEEVRPTWFRLAA